MTGTELPPLLLVGCGKMGGAMLAGWLERGLRRCGGGRALCGRRRCLRRKGARGGERRPKSPDGFRPGAVVLAIKPQEAMATLPACRPLRRARHGVPFHHGRANVAGMRDRLGDRGGGGARHAQHAGRGAAGLHRRLSPAGVSPAQRELADALLASVGEVAWVEEEALLDPVTAVSGGGPAYVFLLAEVMEPAAIEQGLPPDLARRMARATVAGSGALLARSAEDAAALRRAVTSPKGTTERALDVLMAPEAWPALMSRAIEAATARSRELAGSRGASCREH